LADKSEGDTLIYFTKYRGDNLIYTYTTNLCRHIWRWYTVIKSTKYRGDNLIYTYTTNLGW
jgi:hypothetical protein